jgi:hypothetical protein
MREQPLARPFVRLQSHIIDGGGSRVDIKPIENLGAPRLWKITVSKSSFKERPRCEQNGGGL